MRDWMEMQTEERDWVAVQEGPSQVPRMERQTFPLE
jgi:hypothetical protein